MRIALIGAELEENLALRYLWAALEQAGHTTCILPFNREADIEVVSGQVTASGAALVGLSMVFTHRAHEFARLAGRIRKRVSTGSFTPSFLRHPSNRVTW